MDVPFGGIPMPSASTIGAMDTTHNVVSN
jgi:hypothetical protein